jgi:glutamyl-tRNA synthetase
MSTESNTESPMQPTIQSSLPIRTRFAPSPTGFLHIGGARTALFSWAFARHYQGTFILRIEDTDLERSTPEATQAILDGLKWLNLQQDEGPFYQTQRMDRYKEVIATMLADGRAYHCFASKDELEVMRTAQEAAGQKPRYDGRWRPEADKVLPAAPTDIKPVVRFKNPIDGVVTWTDLVKGDISIANAEMDDLIIARSDGTPTYNFCVVVDDLDMQITHIIRGDDHVNNTPRQINILRALGGAEPRYGHVPLLHGPDGQKLSKRHGAVSVMQYDTDGYLPEAICNYLSRLGWSHGDNEIFNREQFVQWFDGEHITKGPARFDFDKLKWVNQHYMQAMDNAELVQRLQPFLKAQSVDASSGSFDIAAIVALLKERCSTLIELAQWVARFVNRPQIDSVAAAEHLTPSAKNALAQFANSLEAIEIAGHNSGSNDQARLDREAIAGCVKSTLTALGLKMPQLAMPARLAVFGTAQTPSLDAMLALLPKGEVLGRLRAAALKV